MTRTMTGNTVDAKNVPWLIGGAADLAPSTKIRPTFDGAGDFVADDYSRRNFHFSIHEHAIGAILNGLALCKVRAFGASAPLKELQRKFGFTAEMVAAAAKEQVKVTRRHGRRVTA